MNEKMDELLQKRKKWRKKLEYYKKGFKDGILSQKEYNEKYEEIMDKLVGIEDKIIQEKLKDDKKKEIYQSERGHEDKIKELEEEIRVLKQSIKKDQTSISTNKEILGIGIILIVVVSVIITGSYFWSRGGNISSPQETRTLSSTTVSPTPVGTVEEKGDTTNSELRITNITNDNRTFYIVIRNSTGYYLVNDDGDGKIEVNESSKRSEVRVTIQDNSGNTVAEYVVNDYNEETAKFTSGEGIHNDEEGQIEVTVAEREMKAGETYIIIVTAAGTTTTEKYTAI